jgi:hypothetical protein
MGDLSYAVILESLDIYLSRATAGRMKRIV